MNLTEANNRTHSRFPINKLECPDNKLIVWRKIMKKEPLPNRENIAIYKARKDYRENRRFNNPYIKGLIEYAVYESEAESIIESTKEEV
jgi:hypothetical protein